MNNEDSVTVCRRLSAPPKKKTKDAKDNIATWVTGILNSRVIRQCSSEAVACNSLLMGWEVKVMGLTLVK